MAKKILAIFFVSILLCSYIIPTTSAFADVVIGDNDSYAVTELGIENGKKIATMEAMLQLLESGVSEINYDGISDLDNYLEDFYDELTNVNYQDVFNEILAGAYNDVKQLKTWIDNRGEYIATYYKDYLNSADEGLSDIFNQFQLKLPKSELNGNTSLRGIEGLSRFRGDNNPTPSPDPNYQTLIDRINLRNENNPYQFWFYNYATEYYNPNQGETLKSNYTPWTSYTWARRNASNGSGEFDKYATPNMMASNVIDIYITSSNGVYSWDYYFNSLPSVCIGKEHGYQYGCIWLDKRSGTQCLYGDWYGSTQSMHYNYSGSVGEVLQYIGENIKNANIYVDGVPWSIVSSTIPPTLNIDGFIKIYNHSQPIVYEFPQGTQIDYNALYTTIYNAIRDNLPLDMQTINNNQVYYDSHDTVYSPTIYNYYGKDGDDENDWIDSILDYATIPDFNAVLGTVAVLDAPFVNGITIINTGISDVIPTEILIILGAGFVLVLFVCIINRMSE